MRLFEPALRTVWGPGPVGDAVQASYENRLTQFIQNEESESIQLFSEESKKHSKTGDWYGEHAGKWLVAASHAYRRTASESLAESIRTIVDFLVQNQESDGYLGTYADDAEARLSKPNASKVRTWDVWIHAWIILGLLKVSDIPGVLGAQESAQKVGDLLLTTFSEGRSMLDLGNHQGLSSAVIIEPLSELTLATGNPDYAQLAVQLVEQMEARGIHILSGKEKGTDIAEIGTGKVYQLCWILVGLVSVHRATGDERYLRAAEYWFDNISEHHLTPFGGPWGGVATHKEVFNSKDFFDPSGLTETCSIASWMSLCRELFLLAGNSKFIDNFERSLTNGLVGAMDENGADWCYFTFPNGRRNNTYHWACCKSSGAMALEEAASFACTTSEDGVFINLWESFESDFIQNEKSVHLTQTVKNGSFLKSEIKVCLANSAEFDLRVRIPAWGKNAQIEMNGISSNADLDENGFLLVSRTWSNGDEVSISLEVNHAVHLQTYSLDHHGQEVVRTDYAYLSWGPYVYATGLIDGYKKSETLRLPKLNPEGPFVASEAKSKAGLPVFDLIQPGRPPIPFAPYFEAGGRHDSAWRATWIQVAWQ